MRLSVPWLLLAASAWAQPPEVDIGNAGLELKGPWRMQVGDNRAWADPAFDDSAWPEVMVPSDPRDRGPVKLPNMVWYRWHGRLGPAVPERLGLFIGLVPNAWEVFVNGHNIGNEGFWLRGPVSVGHFLNRNLSVPGNLARPRHEILIAIRVYLSAGKRYGYLYRGASFTFGRPAQPPLHYYGVPLPFGLLNAPLLGDERYIKSLIKASQGDENTSYLTFALPGLLAGLIWLYLYRLRREMRELLWFGMAWVGTMASNVILLLVTRRIDGQWVIVVNQICIMSVFYCVTAGAFVFWRSKVPRWLAIPLALGTIASITGLPGNYSSSVFFLVPCVYSLMFVPISVGLWRRGGMDDRLFAVLILANTVTTLPDYGSDLAIRAGWIAAPQSTSAWVVRYSIVDYILATFALPLIFSIILMRRFNRTLSQRERLGGELASAREMQMALIPPRLISVAGLTIESAFIPAYEVGGDFFQVLPNDDGSVLLVAGDVSGKGLKAAMLVTLVVGALRNRRATRPAGVLAELNTALQGQCGGGFVTCCCALFREDAVFIANAGHIPPYCDGVPVEVESSLPLGIVSGLDFIETRLDAGFGDRFVFMSDGIAEARNAAGDLLGFDAVRALAHASPAEIAQRAQRFGQEDDMTVIEVQRLATEAHAA